MAIRDGAELAALLAEPWPLAWADGLFERDPTLRCWFGRCTLDEICAWSVCPAALRWVEGQVVHDPGAAETARLRAVVFRDEHGTPVFGDSFTPGTLPAGVIDRLLLASDCATGYRPPTPSFAAGPADGGLAALLHDYAARRTVSVAGLLPQAHDAELWVRGYGFAALAAGERASWLDVPGGGAVRVDVLAWPLLLADALRTGPAPDAAPLADETLCRQLPYGAARALVETADGLSELGGAQPGVRFQRPSPTPSLDRAESLAVATDGPLPV